MVLKTGLWSRRADQSRGTMVERGLLCGGGERASLMSWVFGEFDVVIDRPEYVVVDVCLARRDESGISVVWMGEARQKRCSA